MRDKSILHNMIATEDLYINDLIKIVGNKYCVKLTNAELHSKLSKSEVYTPIKNIKQNNSGTVINDFAIFNIEK